MSKLKHLLVGFVITASILALILYLRNQEIISTFHWSSILSFCAILLFNRREKILRRRQRKASFPFRSGWVVSIDTYLFPDWYWLKLIFCYFQLYSFQWDANIIEIKNVPPESKVNQHKNQEAKKKPVTWKARIEKGKKGSLLKLRELQWSDGSERPHIL